MRGYRLRGSTGRLIEELAVSSPRISLANIMTSLLRDPIRASSGVVVRGEERSKPLPEQVCDEFDVEIYVRKMDLLQR